MSASVVLGEFEPVQIAAPAEQPRNNGNPLGFSVTTVPAGMRTAALRGDNVPMVARVDQLGPAAGSGLGRGHVIRRFNGAEIRTVRDLERAASSVRSGQVVSLIVVDAADPEAIPTIVNYRIQ
jgi:S1-C subfamily serine protease